MCPELDLDFWSRQFHFQEKFGMTRIEVLVALSFASLALERPLQLHLKPEFGLAPCRARLIGLPLTQPTCHRLASVGVETCRRLQCDFLVPASDPQFDLKSPDL
jgi:hypothetical protein